MHTLKGIKEVDRKLLLRFLHSPHPCGLATQEQLPGAYQAINGSRLQSPFSDGDPHLGRGYGRGRFLPHWPA